MGDKEELKAFCKENIKACLDGGLTETWKLTSLLLDYSIKCGDCGKEHIEFSGDIETGLELWCDCGCGTALIIQKEVQNG